ncbi:NAD(P)-dependent oxidoreductase [Amedibacillus sp. YH-ame10]
MEKIAVINITSFGREFPEYIEELESKVGKVDKFLLPADMDGATLAERLDGYSYILLGNYPQFDETFFSLQKDVKLIARHGIGYNNIDLESARRHGVFVTVIPHVVEEDAVAEQAAALLMAVSKNIVRADQKVHIGQWNINRQEIMGYQLRDGVTGIIGCGHIGKRMAQIMKYGFHNRILAYDPYLSKEDADLLGVELCDLITLLQTSDFISLHANLNENSKHLINAETLQHVSKHAILINTGRGGLVDEEALADALEQGQLAGYGADVAGYEPMDVNSRLLKMENVTITPHSAIYNRTCMSHMNRKVMEDVYLVASGKRPNEIINGL